MADQLHLLSFHLSYLIGQSSSLPVIVFNVGVQVCSGALALLLQIILLSLDPIFVKLKLTLFFAHLMSKLFKHGDLLPGLFVHQLGLLGHLGVVTGLGLLAAQTPWLDLLEVIDGVILFIVRLPKVICIAHTI